MYIHIAYIHCVCALHTHTYTHTHTHTHRASLVAQMIKNLPALQETWVWTLGWEDALEEGMITYSSILAWRMPMDKGAWWATVHGVAKNQTRLSDWAQHSMYTHMRTHTLYTCIDDEDLAHTIKDFEKSQNLLSVNWRPRKSSGVIPIWTWRPGNQGANGVNPVPRVEDVPAQEVGWRRMNPPFLHLSLYWGPHQIGLMATHIGESNLLYKIYWFKCWSHEENS